MKFSPIYCPECKERAEGTVDTVVGIACFTEADGRRVDYEGTTKMDWNSQRANRDKKGRYELICSNGHTWFAKKTEK
jgi:hypothetical protein